MRKTIRNGIDRRAVYKFACTGGCNKIKSSYVYDRAKGGVCMSCSKKIVNGDQDSLFKGMDVSISENEINFNFPDSKTNINVETGEIKSVDQHRKDTYLAGQDQS